MEQRGSRQDSEFETCEGKLAGGPQGMEWVNIFATVRPSISSGVPVPGLERVSIGLKCARVIAVMAHLRFGGFVIYTGSHSL